METKRIIIFLFGCILTRLFITLIAMKIKPTLLPYFGYIALGIAISFFYLYFVGNATADAQLEWLGDKKIWWNELRPVHGSLFLLFAIFAIQQKSYSWVLLLIDTLVGLGAWLIHHKFITL
jgi:hypothetical protein